MSISYNKIQPKLTIVGAGPGNPDLITVKGIHTLSSADVVLYDAFVNTELLKYAPAQAKKIYVGRRGSGQPYTQDQLNALIVDLAFTHGHVVRLSTGDPSVFERTLEETTYAELFNIETDIVPGISHAIPAGNTDTIVDAVKRKNILAPAVIVAGEAVKLHPLPAYTREQDKYLLN